MNREQETTIMSFQGCLADARHEAGALSRDQTGWEGLERPEDPAELLAVLESNIEEFASYSHVYHWLDDMYEAKLCRKNLAAVRRIAKDLKSAVAA